MTVLINQLFEEAILKKPIKVISNFSEKTDFDRYRKKHAQIFRNKSVLASNLRGEIPHPYLLATMTRRKDQEKDLKAYTLWYDFAGEDYEKSDEMDAVIQYFTAIGGIFFLVDPSNSEKVVKILGIEANDPDQGANEMRDEGVLTQIGSIVGKHGTDESFHQKHIAVIVSKVDLFKDSKFEHFREDSIIWQPSPHQSAGEFSLDDFRQVNEEVEKYLMKYHKAIYGQIVRFHNGKDDIMESNVGYFAVSALGQNPVGDRKVGLKLEKKVSPIRVEDPFYWMLWKMGHLPASSEEAPSTPPPEKEEDEGSFGGGGLFD
ncbi:MAG: hypothetical protein H6559_24935 [Lewinellaceae bacterium]|nr:hypothetical protein [Lewinellaceae bacterium]